MLETLLTAPASAAPAESVAAWWPRHRAIAAQWPTPIEQAIAGGYCADRLGWAFASGYQAALRALAPGLPNAAICALCVTEAGGNHPRAIRTTLRAAGGGFVLNGAKRWTTLGPEGSVFLVAAREAEAPGERPRLRLARVASDLPGVQVEPMPSTRFVPEVPHAQLRFENVALYAGDVLPGDGYDDYVKPFRTAEDTHVHAAALAYLVREARRLGWPRGWTERAVANLQALAGIAALERSAAATHIALAGALAAGAALIAETGPFWSGAGADPAAARWSRDRPLLDVASQARAQRTERAWERLAPSA